MSSTRDELNSAQLSAHYQRCGLSTGYRYCGRYLRCASGIWSVPCYVYFYTLGGYGDYIPYSWCFAYNSLTEFIPSTFHTASIWLTVTLAVQRYIYVCRALTARRLCTVPNFARVIVVIFAVAVLSQISRFFESSYTPVQVQSLADPNKVRSIDRLPRDKRAESLSAFANPSLFHSRLNAFTHTHTI